jgi:hypothetical protein
VYAPDAAGAEEANADTRADGERSADGCCAELAACAGDCDVPRADLARAFSGRRKPLELALGQADLDVAVDDADRCRHGTCLAHATFRFEGNSESLLVGKTVRDERCLERNDGPKVVARFGDFGSDLDHGVAPSFATALAALSSASSTPPTR